MNVYDFDGTIYAGDCSVDFFLYAVKRKPILLRRTPRLILGFVAYWLKLIDKTQLKEQFFSFLELINAQQEAEYFWEKNRTKIYAWYLEQRCSDDVVISASPEFLLKPICRRLGIQFLIASQVDPSSGNFLGPNCRGDEKVRRFKQTFRETRVDRFYSDSQSDLPFAQIASEAFFVQKGDICQWPF